MFIPLTPVINGIAITCYNNKINNENNVVCCRKILVHKQSLFEDLNDKDSKTILNLIQVSGIRTFISCINSFNDIIQWLNKYSFIIS